jgi:hypothetical protein
MGLGRTLSLLGVALIIGCATAPARPVAKIALPEGTSHRTPPPANEKDDGKEEDGAVETADVAAAPDEDAADDGCPANMALVDGKLCVDKWEASLVEVLPDGTEKPYPHYMPVDGHEVRAVSAPGVFPQGFISEVQARDACAASNKRLCTHAEWKTACMGPSKTTFPYGQTRMTGVCRDNGKSAVIAVFGAKAVAASTSFLPPRTVASSGGKAAPTKKSKTRKGEPGSKKTAKATKKIASKARRVAAAKKSVRPASVDPGVWARLNEPALGQVDGALGKTGEHIGCVNGWGLYDMVGNLHEWVATDPALPNGTFAGGYYLDTTLNGDGCHYRTVAHAHDYHDYSTGFRCCADATEMHP